MPVSKDAAPGNQPKTDTKTENQSQTSPAPADIRRMETPHGDTSVSPLTPSQAHPERGFHDAISGRPVDEQGRFTDGTPGGVTDPTHIVADDWPDHVKHSKTDQTVHNRTTDGTN